MTKMFRRTISLALVLALCMVLTLPTSANSQVCLTNEYGKFQGKCYQNTQNPYILNISASVTKNDNGSYLRMYIDVWGLGDSIFCCTDKSAAGDLLLAHDLLLYPNIDFEPERVFVEHGILDPITQATLYEVYTYEVLTFNN